MIKVIIMRFSIISLSWVFSDVLIYLKFHLQRVWCLKTVNKHSENGNVYNEFETSNTEYMDIIGNCNL